MNFGRLHVEDRRDRCYSMKRVLPATSEVEVRYWDDEMWWGDQGSSPHCVGYSWCHWLEDAPVINQHPNPALIYQEAQKIDEWPGEDYEGTSVRAGAKVITELGYISEYRWAWDAETIAQAVLNVGPVVVGTDWTDDMMVPDENGIIQPTGYLAGGHAYLLNGYDSNTGLFRIKNSWGRGWGINGHAFIHFDDVDNLMAWYGEACLATELALGPDPEPEPEPLEPKPCGFWCSVWNWFLGLFL